MKVNIRKYAEGGGGLAFVQPNFIIDTPTPTAPITKSAGSSGSQTTDKEGILDDDIYKELLKSGGLTSDVNSLIAELGKADYSPMGLSDSYNTSKILKLIGKVNEIKNNKAMWDEAIETSRDTGGYAETAISNTGELFYRTSEGGIGTTNITQLKKNPEKYSSLLSVADLLLMREKNPGLAFNTSIFNIAQSSVGIDKVMENIKDLFSTLTDYTEISERHYSKEDVKRQYQLEKEALQRTGRKPTQEEVRGIKSLAELQNTPGEFLKVELEESRKGKDLKAALRYIMAGLGAAELKKLEFAAITNGYSKGEEMIADMLINQSGGKSSSKISPEKRETVFGTDSDSGGNKAAPRTAFELQNNGQIGREVINWNDPKSGLSMAMQGNRVDIWDKVESNTRVGMGPLRNLLNSHTGALLEKGKIYFGSNKVELSDYDNIIIDPSSGSARVYFPVDDAGNPDYEIMRKIDELKEKAPSNLNPEELTKYFAERGYNFVQFDENFQMRPNNSVKPFLLLYGFADEKSSSAANNKEIRELQKAEEEAVEGILQSEYAKLKMKKPTGILNWSNTYYKGNILIPYQKDSSIIAAAMADNITAPKTSVENAIIHSNTEYARIINADSNIFNQR